MCSGGYALSATMMSTAVMEDQAGASTHHRVGLAIVSACEAELWGVSLTERLERTFARAGISHVVHNGAELAGLNRVITARADYVFEERLIKALISRPNVILVSNDPLQNARVPIAANAPASRTQDIMALMTRGHMGSRVRLEGMEVLSASELGGVYDEALRKQSIPYAVSAKETPLHTLEALTFGASYKGATDFVTKFLWPKPARLATKWAAERGITPNTVTTASLMLVLIAMWLFWQGHFVTGCLAAWMMTFLDTVDGKLARVTLTSTKWGNAYDHGIDLIHPPFWWWAWWTGLQTVMDPALAPAVSSAFWIIVGGYVAGRILEGIFIFAFKIETHIWRPIDYFFRHITARRNPNLAILTLSAIAGRPDLGFIAVAIWTVISLVFHAERLLHAAATQMSGGKIGPFINNNA